MNTKPIAIFCCIFLWSTFGLHAQVNFEKGSKVVQGIQLLQDHENPSKYYYIPPYPRLSMSDDSTYEFLCIQYVGKTLKESGGIFHALFEFTLPEDIEAMIKEELKKNGRRIGRACTSNGV